MLGDTEKNRSAMSDTGSGFLVNSSVTNNLYLYWEVIQTMLTIQTSELSAGNTSIAYNLNLKAVKMYGL